ncbi:hypothetical protein ILUMI_18504 [Ignelater luminosus]|uniref:Uncharacterized protein n=1 Tax=Ignelater luminosus TaxID=2038154 RepID=A0A8K0G6C1_IGNLU|nr:hypothetical protein ILUMI_18504 [Ignelater luminosus]
MIHLSSSKACLKLPRNVEDFLRSVGAHFSRSSHRQLKFKKFQEFFQVEIHRILAPAQTRWLSVKACVDRVLEQYIPLKAYLAEAVFSDPNATHFLGLDEIIIGVKAGESMENLKKDEDVPRAAIADFYETCQKFYIELTSDVTKRFDFRDTLFSIISTVNPSEAQQFKIQSLAPVFR